MATLNFDSAAVEPQAPMSGEPIPAGIYVAEITDSQVKDLKSGNGTGLQLEFTIIEPAQFSGRKVWSNLNIKHTNETAEQIAQAQLSAICRALGIGVLKDSDELFGKVLKVRTKIRAAQGDYPARSEVTGYEPAGVAKPAAPAQQAKASAPWAKKAA